MAVRILRARTLRVENFACRNLRARINWRTKFLARKVLVTRLGALRWGWHNDNFTGVHERLMRAVACYRNMSEEHADTFNAIENSQSQGEERRARQLHQILDVNDFNASPTRFKTIGDVKRVYGDVAEVKLREALRVEDALRRLFAIYNEATFNQHLPKSLEIMERVLHYIHQYAKKQLQRRAWAEKMQARNLKHFFAEDFYENWYNLIVKELDQLILKTVIHAEEMFPQNVRDNLNANAELSVIGSVLLFNDVAHGEMFAVFLADMLNCTLGDVRNATLEMLVEFRKAMHHFQSAAENLFGKELPDYLRNFEFGPRFIKENFAQVNIFLHKMNVEHWMQEPTYSIWSLFCDIGGALGLFLGASLLTLIEVAYFVVQTKVYRKLFFWKNDLQVNNVKTELRKPTRIHVHPQRRRRYFSFHGSMNGSLLNEPVDEDSIEYVHGMSQLRNRHNATQKDDDTQPLKASQHSPSYQSAFERRSTSSLIPNEENVFIVNESSFDDVNDLKTSKKMPLKVFEPINDKGNNSIRITPPAIPPRSGNALNAINPQSLIQEKRPTEDGPTKLVERYNSRERCPSPDIINNNRRESSVALSGNSQSSSNGTTRQNPEESQQQNKTAQFMHADNSMQNNGKINTQDDDSRKAQDVRRTDQTSQNEINENDSENFSRILAEEIFTSSPSPTEAAKNLSEEPKVSPSSSTSNESNDNHIPTLHFTDSTSKKNSII